MSKSLKTEKRMELKKQNFDEFETCIENRDLYLFGASKSAENFIMRNSKYDIKGFFDNNRQKWNTIFCGYMVYSFDTLFELDKDKVVILITSVYEDEIEMQLKKLGYHNIFSSHICEKEGIMNWLLPIKREDYPNIELLESMLSDDLSKKRLHQIVANRESNNPYWGEIFDGSAYFNTIFDFNKTEVFVDAGAFTGDTIDLFLQHVNYEYEKIYAYEPDEINFELLCNKYKQVKNIVCKKSGLWSKKTTLRFEAKNNEGSKISNEGTEIINVSAIDDLKNDKISFIKMDIEGAELNALVGAKETIKKYKPKLAICIYHKYDDLWKIPFYVKELVPEYKLYIRHHSLGCFDTVLYAAI